mmetsp:Transcript_34446/g.50728  ORF Transcript_34446/g.50728 Transcript_34446/m.50728 type:complete len:458 (+) Transcript_34446:213-1586(+)
MDSDAGSSMEEPLYEFDDDEDMTFAVIMEAVHRNGPYVTELEGSGGDNWIQSMSNEDWEQLGRGVSNHTHLESLRISEGALNDQRVAFFFRGLMRSSSISEMHLYENEIGVAGVQSMVPFLQSAANLRWLNLDDTNLQSEGFNLLLWALRGSPIEKLSCARCGIESIEIDNNNFPQHLKHLSLSLNSIKADGCRGLAKLLQGGGARLSTLWVNHNKIDDDGVEILVDALQNNTSLKTLDLKGNDGISDHGDMMLLQLVNDVSSIKATLQSNHTLTKLHISQRVFLLLEPNTETQAYIKMATEINRGYGNGNNPEEAGREKVIETQLRSETRAELCRLQGVDHSLFNEIDPLHLPDVLALIGRSHGHGELYDALSSSIMLLFSTVNVKKCIQQERDHHLAEAAEHAAKLAEHRAKAEQLDAKLAAMEEVVEVEGNERDPDNGQRSNKRRRKWWWGLWG